MATENSNSYINERLRLEAEKRLSSRSDMNIHSDDLNYLVHNLKLHQVELEMQNEELQRSSYEAELYSSRYNNLFEFAPVALFILDRFGIMKELNICAVDFLGLPKEKIINKRFQAFIHSSFTDGFYFFNHQILNTDQKQTIELKMDRNKGNYAHVIVEGIRVGRQHQKTCDLLVAVIDISERKNAAEALLKAHKELDEKVKVRTKELEDANLALHVINEEKLIHAEKIFELNAELIESEKKLRELNEKKDKFFAIMAHDLRSPFASLVGYSKLLKEKIDTLNKEEIKEYADNIFTYASNFERLVNDLLCWSNLQWGNFSFNPKNIEIEDLAKEVVKLFSSQATAKNIKLNTRFTGPARAYGDVEMISSVLRNLVSNSLKFTKIGGEVEISAEDNGIEVVMKVKDNGIGIPERIMKRLFKIDQQALSIGTANERGNGMGLLLVKEFVEKNAGKVWVESEPAKGTTFYVALPKTSS